MIQSRDKLVDDLWLRLILSDTADLELRDRGAKLEIQNRRRLAEWLADAMLEVQAQDANTSRQD